MYRLQPYVQNKRLFCSGKWSHSRNSLTPQHVFCSKKVLCPKMRRALLITPEDWSFLPDTSGTHFKLRASLFLDLPVSGHSYELFEMVKLLHVRTEDEKKDKHPAHPNIALAKSGGYSGHEFMAFYLSNGILK